MSVRMGRFSRCVLSILTHFIFLSNGHLNQKKKPRSLIRVMLHITIMLSFYPHKIDMTFKITIGSKFNSSLS
jgi:hypothetical protein